VSLVMLFFSRSEQCICCIAATS